MIMDHARCEEHNLSSSNVLSSNPLPLMEISQDVHGGLISEDTPILCHRRQKKPQVINFLEYENNL